MARPKNFNETDVIDAAMLLFWSQGYVATGVSQILETTQLQPGSFYNLFSSKKELFIRSLERYRDQIIANRIANLLSTKDPIQAIEDYFSVFEPLRKEKIIGCLLTNTATEVGIVDTDINQVVWLGLHQIEMAFERRIVDARNEGLLPPTVDPEATALHLLSCLQGMSVIARLTQDKTKLRSLKRTALQSLHSGA